MSDYLNAIGLYAGGIFVLAIAVRRFRQWNLKKHLEAAQREFNFNQHKVTH